MEVLISQGRFANEVDSDLIRDAAVFAMSRLGLPDRAELSITLAEDDEIADLNLRFRGRQGPTDVLSFECDSLKDEFSDQDAFIHDEIYTLGDIVIAPEVARRQACEFDVTFKDEMETLLFHGILHLCGYDHIDDGEALIMEKRQARLLDEWRQRK